MRFLKENSGNIVKLYVNQIGVAIFSIFLYTAAAVIKDNRATKIILLSISAFAILFYYMLVYNVMWEIGAKDKIRIDSGRIEKQKSKGFIMGLYANIPNFVIFGLQIIFHLLYMFTNVKTFEVIYGLIIFVYNGIFASLYSGVISTICNLLTLGEASVALIETSLYIVFSLISALVIYLSYLMGLSDKRIFPRAKSNK